MSVQGFYETYFINKEGHLVASFPEEGGRVEQTFDKKMFCLVYSQVSCWYYLHFEIHMFKTNETEIYDEDIEVTFRFCYKENRHIDGEVLFYMMQEKFISIIILLEVYLHILPYCHPYIFPFSLHDTYCVSCWSWPAPPSFWKDNYWFCLQ